MKITRRTRLTSLIERKLVVDSGERCPSCSSEDRMLSINEAARAGHRSWRDIILGMKNGELHYVETENGEIYVCGESLRNAPKRIL